MLDDWALAADHKRFGGFFAMAHHLLGNSALVNAGGRPLAALYFGTSYSLFGSNAALHLAFGIVLSALMSTALYVVLRTLGVERLHAAALALLVLVFPAADAPRLWPTAGQGVLAIFLFLCGVLLAVRAAQLGLKIVDVPVRYHARTYGRTNISRFEHGWMLLKMAISGFVDLKVRPARVWSVRSRTTRLNPR